MRIEFSGYSDDTFGEHYLTNDYYDNCASGKPIRWRLYSESQDAELLVVGQYCPFGAGGWLVGIAPADHPDGEDRFSKASEWGVVLSIGKDPDVTYSPTLVIENAPNDCELTCLERES